MPDAFIFKSKQLLGKRSCKKGDVILRSNPFVHVINYARRGQYCDSCLSSSSRHVIKSCKDCNYSWYCSEKCQLDDEPLHSIECRALKKLGPNYVPPNFARLMLRLLIKLKNGGDSISENYAPHKARKFKDLMNHYRDIKANENRMKDVRSMMKILGTMIGPHNVPNEVDFIGLYGRILVNRFCLMDELLCPMGSAVYLAGSVFDHSCRPNAYPSFDGKTLVIRSLVNWSELDFTKVFISYIDVVATTASRRQELQSNWYFWCECVLCRDKERATFENSVACENPDCKAPVQLPEKAPSAFNPNRSALPLLECEVCGWEVEENTLLAYQSAVAFTRQRLKAMKEEAPSIESCKAILERQGNLFSSMNCWRVRTIDFIFNACFNKLVCLSTIEYGYQNLDAMKYYYGEEHPTLGLFYMKMAKVLMYVRQFKEGLKYVEQAQEVLTIALGTEHLLVKEELHKLYMMASEDLDIMLERRMKATAEKEKLRRESQLYNPFLALFAIKTS